MQVGKLQDLFNYLSDLEIEHAFNSDSENFEPFTITTGPPKNTILINFHTYKPDPVVLDLLYGIKYDKYYNSYIYSIT